MNSTPNRRSVAEIIATYVALSTKTQREIATECGFDSANVITMLKTGKTKVPLNRIGLIAKAIDADPAYLLRIAMMEYLPDTWHVVEAISKRFNLTQNEVTLIQRLRHVSMNSDPQVLECDFRDHTVLIRMSEANPPRSPESQSV